MASQALEPRNPVVRWWRRWQERPTAVLAPYKIERQTLRQRLAKRTIIATIGFVGFMYGFLVALFPYWLYYWLALPIVVLTLLVIWALPATNRAPERAIEWCFWAFFVGLVVWPNYLAISIPGFPWITIQRLFLGPMAFLLLVAVSQSASFRARIAAPLKASPLISKALIAFVAIQTVTLFFSTGFGNTINRFISNQLQWTAIFFVSVLLFQKPGRARRWMVWLMLMIVFVSVLGFWEYRVQRVPWADHIPSFLAVADERVQDILFKARTRSAFSDQYRTTSVFFTSQNFAEVLGLAMPIAIYLFTTAQTQLQRLLYAALFPFIFAAIYTTDSRIGYICFFGSWMVFGFLWAARRWYNRRGDLVGISLTLMYPVFGAVFFVLSLFWLRLYRMIWGGGQYQSSTDARKEQWALFWPKIGHWPFGNGVGSSGEVLGYFTPDGTLTLDSYYIALNLEYGVLGFAAFMTMFIAAIIVCGRLAIEDKRGEIFAPLAILMLLFIIVKGVFAQENAHALIFMVLGMVVALRYRVMESAGALRQHTARPLSR